MTRRERRHAAARLRTYCTVMTKNGPSALARLTKALTAESIALGPMTFATAGREAAIQFMAEPPRRLLTRLRRMGFSAEAAGHLQREVSSQPRALHRLVDRLEQAGLTVRSLVGTDSGGSARLVAAPLRGRPSDGRDRLGTGRR